MNPAALIEAFDCICEALAQGHDAIVEVIRHDDGSFSIDWGVAHLPLLRANPNRARLVAKQMETSGWHPEIGEMLRTAADFCDRDGKALH